ncbi:RNase E specificity factor CsrD [Shewanella waksmanii]|uniref:RNase E specificity factor CsrD n=1 Tax=Shewanella waksmanii TaxID=213783 RepID=UPI00048AAC91|nr:RNase E specificity factor CsrD [Shewanella waksmanii]
MKLTQMLTRKLTSFWLLSLVAVACIFLLTASLSFVQLTYKFQQQKVDEIQSLLGQHSAQQLSQPHELSQWLPQILQAFQTQNFVLYEGEQRVYHYQAEVQHLSSVSYQRNLLTPANYSMELTLPKPFLLHDISMYEVILLLVGLIATALLVMWGYRWLALELEGVEDLAKRSHLILSDDYDKALAETGHGRPRMINRALTKMLLELDDAEKQRARFDQFIRSNTFLDPETGIGNQLFLKNRLDALSNDAGMLAPGVLYLLEMADLDLLQQDLGEEPVNEMLGQVIAAIGQVLDGQANSIFSRRSQNQFALVVPQISLQDTEKLANKLLKVCQAQLSDELLKQQDFFHIGVAYFKVGDNKTQLVEEAEMALRAAQFQGSSNWFMYDKGAVDEGFAKGSVRWRSFLEYALVNKRVVAFSQPVVDSDMQTHHLEVSSRLRDNQGTLVRATLFLPMAIKCGLTPQIERQVIETVLFDLLNASKDGMSYSINLSLDTLTSRAFVRWLRTTLLEYRHLTSRLIFEINEDIIVNHTESLKGTLDMINKMGARLCVDRVGLQVVSTQYIKTCQIDLIKLHRSIVSQIHLRQENQLFVRSLIGGLYRTEVQVFAEGVDVFEEWQTLKILGVSAAQGSLFSDPVEEI